MFIPQHVAELLRDRLHHAADAARQMSADGPVLDVADLLSRYGLAQVQLRDADLAIVNQRAYSSRVPDRFVPDRTVTAQLKDYTVALPFDGDPAVVRVILSSCLHTPTWTVPDGELRATFTVSPTMPPAELKTLIDNRVADAQRHVDSHQNDLEKYRDQLLQVVTSVLAQIRAAHAASESQLDGLSIPVRAKAQAPAQPAPSSTAPAAPSPPAVATGEDAVLEQLFEKVVGVIRSIGHELEAFTGLTDHLRREEHHRDVVLVGLRVTVPECSSTGETMHGQGKNDIHVRHGNRVVGVFEFKVWDTESEFKVGIDQLLSYLPYRDTRCAYVLLIRNQDVSAVVEKTKHWLREHSNCDDPQVPDGDWRVDYRYHATGDPAQAIKLVYLPFAFSTSATGGSTTRGLAGGIAATP